MLVLGISVPASAQMAEEVQPTPSVGFYAFAPRWLVDMPTAGTLPRASFDVAIRLYPGGGSLGMIDIGLSSRMQLGIAYGGQNIISNSGPHWNPNVEFNLKFRIIDELEYFPGVTIGFMSQGFGAYESDLKRYAYKSRGFFAVASRSFYFYNWTSGWHAGVNYSLENDIDEDDEINFFGGFDATFRYNLAFVIEYDAALNDDRSTLPGPVTMPNYYGGKGRGYLNTAIRWLFTDNLELELLVKDLFINRRESSTVTREIRITYLETF